MTPTPLDQAHAAMEAAPDDDAKRLRFFERLADAELFVLLEKEAQGDQIEPRLFPVEDTSFVLGFDREERLASFAGGPAPYMGLSGRALAGALGAQGVGLGLNLDVAPSAMLLPPEALSWLTETLGETPDKVEAKLAEILPPTDLPENLITAIDTKLGLAVGLARYAYLCAVLYEGGGRGHMLAFIDAIPGSEPSLANAVKEALVFSGIEAGALDVGFFRAQDPMAAKLAMVGLRFDLPMPEKPSDPVAPGCDPNRPPILR